MKRIFSCLLVITLVISMSGGVAYGYTAKDVAVTPGSQTATVDGEEITLDVAAKIINDRTMIPIRFVAENLGFQVEWNNAARIVTIGENAEISLPIGSKTATVNGETVSLDAPAVIESSRTLVPLRFISESLGADVGWNAEDRVATISYSPQMIAAKALYGTAGTAEEEVLAALDYDWAYDFATELAAFGDAERGFHLVGSTAGKKAAQYAYDTFKEIGLDPQFSTFDAQGWEYYDSSLSIAGKPELDYFITSAPHTPATSAEGVTAPLVYCGTGTKDELDALDLAGKIALVNFDWDYTLWMNNIEYAVAKRGAVGLIYFTTNPYGTDESGEAEFVADWSGVAATIPTWSMRQVDGYELAVLAENDDLTVTAISDCKTIDDATGYNVLATLRGTKYPNEYIVINAHTDAYFHCLQDDSAPVGIMMAMAKAMVETGYEPERSIVFVTTDGEECGGGETFYDWLVGAWDLVNKKVESWGGKIVDSHTIEMIGDNKSTNFGYRASDPMLLFTEAVAAGMNASDEYDTEVTVDNYMTTSSDEWAFAYWGYPTTRTIMENAADEVYHSSMDTIDRFSYSRFIDHVNAQTALILRIDQQTFGPYDLARDAELYLSSLSPEELDAAGQDYDDLIDAASAYLSDADQLLTTNLEISALYKDAQEAGKNLARVNLLIADYNEAQRQVLETVIKGTEYVALDQPTNQTSYNQYIPTVFSEAIAALENGEEDQLLDIFYSLDIEGMDQYSVWYSECLDYDTWANSYAEALNPDDPDADYKWVSDRLLKYYDFYAVLESVNAKIEAGDSNFAEEIATLTAMKLDAEERLADGVDADTSMWQKADGELPLAKAAAIKKLLTELE